jgi:hypothetical protein
VLVIVVASPLVSRLLLTCPVPQHYVVVEVGDATNTVGMLSRSASASWLTDDVIRRARSFVDIVYICEERMKVRQIVGIPRSSAQMRQMCGIRTWWFE